MGAADWSQGVGTGGTMTSVTDTVRHPDGAKKAIKCDGMNGNKWLGHPAQDFLR